MKSPAASCSHHQPCKFDSTPNKSHEGGRFAPDLCVAPSAVSPCRHEEVAREVLEASKIAADDPAKQFAISFFDNKFNSLVPLKIAYFLR